MMGALPVLVLCLRSRLVVVLGSVYRDYCPPESFLSCRSSNSQAQGPWSPRAQGPWRAARMPRGSSQCIFPSMLRVCEYFAASAQRGLHSSIDVATLPADASLKQTTQPGPPLRAVAVVAYAPCALEMRFTLCHARILRYDPSCGPSGASSAEARHHHDFAGCVLLCVTIEPGAHVRSPRSRAHEERGVQRGCKEGSPDGGR